MNRRVQRRMSMSKQLLNNRSFRQAVATKKPIKKLAAVARVGTKSKGGW